jgi:hypothetical protein
MESLIALVAAPIVLIVGVLATYRRPRVRPAFGTLLITRRKRTWNEPALAQAAERLRR